MKSVKKSDSSCVLYGVPKVQYSFGECTPFPSVLKACLSYMGQEIAYHYVMAASGAAFRLRWNTSFWDGGNVDIMNIYENPYEAFERSLPLPADLSKYFPETSMLQRTNLPVSSNRKSMREGR